MLSIPSLLILLFASFVASIPSSALAPLSKGDGKNPVVPGRYIITLGPRSISSAEFIGTVHSASVNALWNRKEEDHYSWLENLLSQKKPFTLSSSSAPIKAEIKNKYHVGNYRGYSAVLSDEILATIRARSEVRSVDVDQIITLDHQMIENRPKNVKVVSANSKKWKRIVRGTQSSAPWNLVRLSKFKKNNYLNPRNYQYPIRAGNGITTYVIDTGILITHNEFSNGRATWGANFVTDSPNTDENGHGTHVASSVCGSTYGVAKKSNVVAVKVLDAGGSGYYSWVMAGISFAASNAAGNVGKSIMNLSLGGSLYAPLNDLINSVVNDGIFVVVAAGNSDDSACLYSPASAALAITVGAVNESNGFASFSNHGSCVDINAPGVSIIGAWIGSNTATATISGTSMASPHVAGVVALYKSFDPNLSPQQLLTRIKNQSRKGIISSVPAGTVNQYVNIFKLNQKKTFRR